MIYAWAFLIAFLLTLILSPVTMRISRRWDVFSKPKGGEGKGKPCLGGIAIFIASVAGCASIYLFRASYNPKLTGLIISSALIILLGLVDDAKELRPFEKIIVQLIAVGFLVLFGISIKISFFPPLLNAIITFLWILMITNALNLLDIVDGLTSGLVIIIASTLLVISLVNNDVLSSIVLAALIGAHLGFLRYNYPPATLFMGDTGSLFSGFLLAAVAINISYAPPDRPIALITPILAMSLPLYDTFFLMIMRIAKRKPIFSKTNDHFALRLVTMGHSVRKSIWIMYLFCILLALSSIAVAFSSNNVGVVVLIVVILVFIFMGKKVGMVKVEDNQ